VDRLFATPIERMHDFNFGVETTAVFDDMVDRSVPFYAEIQRMVAELAADFAADGSTIYDLGCSTGTTLLHIDQRLPGDVKARLVGVDSSQAMLDKAREKLAAGGRGSADRRELTLLCEDLNRGVEISDASVVIMNLTLQFIRPLYRQRLVRSISDGMREQGALILVEKVMGENSVFNRLFIQHYYEMKKRHGYTEMEIAQKREALENVLVPYRLKENEQLLREAGFEQIDVFFKWYNFCGIIAVK
jgi:tRNA (cmo5U34)-methyltransferase